MILSFRLMMFVVLNGYKRALQIACIAEDLLRNVAYHQPGKKRSG
jgi:hypothetical protein